MLSCDHHLLRHEATQGGSPPGRGSVGKPDRTAEAASVCSASLIGQMRVLMLAPPGGGKGTQGVRIADELGIEHISSGDLLRAAVAADTPVGRQVAEYMAAGKLAPDAVVTEAVMSVLEGREGYVLDGYPRTLVQAEGLRFDVVFHLDVPDAVIIARLLARGRADDSEEVILERIRQYESDTAPLIEHYEDLGVLVRVDGDRPVDDVTAELFENLAIRD